MTQTLTETPHEPPHGETAALATGRSEGTEQRMLHVPGFLDKFLALTNTTAPRDGGGS